MSETAQAKATHSSPQQSELPSGWRWVRLEEITSVVNGTTPDSENPCFWNGDIVWITPTDLGKLAEPYIRNSVRKITKAGFDSRNLTRVPSRSVVLSSRAPIGHLGIAAVELCTNQGCKSFIPNEEVDEWFLYYTLKRSVWKLQQLGSGATFAEISKTQLENFIIPLPPIEEQRRIAGVLREQMATMEKARTAAQARLEAVTALPAAFLRQVFPQPGQSLPDGCRWAPLRKVLILRKDIVHPRDNPEGPSLFVGLEHIESNTGRRLGSVKVEMSELTGRKPRFFKDDIVYGYLRPYLNKVWIAEFNGLCSVDQYSYSVASQIANTSYVAWFMRSPSFIENSPVGKTPGWLPRIRTEEVACVEVPLPPLVEQQRIAAGLQDHMAAVDKARAAVEAELNTINALPAALLRRAFNGEL